MSKVKIYVTSIEVSEPIIRKLSAASAIASRLAKQPWQLKLFFHCCLYTRNSNLQMLVIIIIGTAGRICSCLFETNLQATYMYIAYTIIIISNYRPYI